MSPSLAAMFPSCEPARAFLREHYVLSRRRAIAAGETEEAAAAYALAEVASMAEELLTGTIEAVDGVPVLPAVMYLPEHLQKRPEKRREQLRMVADA